MIRKVAERIVSTVVLLGWLGTASPGQDLRQADASQALSVRLVRPQQQAAAVLSLFEGCPVPHPAAALAAWKRASREPDRLGKPLEAVISFFNPEMVRECGTFDGTEFLYRMGAKPEGAEWRMIVPRDDGTLAAMITAFRLSGGGAEEVVDRGKVSVERLGGPGASVAARMGPQVVLASSRSELERALQAGASGPFSSERSQDAMSGMLFRIEPAGLIASVDSTIMTRRALALARGLGCQLIKGKLGLSGDRLGLDVTSVLAPRSKRPAENQAISSIDLDWLKWVPGGDLVAVVSVATGQGAAYWDEAFAVADRVDRADPVRADLAPLRTRLNLLATAVGTKLEADLWPHLRGLTVGLLADAATPSRPTALLALHMDQDASARHSSREGSSSAGGALGRNQGNRQDRTSDASPCLR